jgi:hypothetical protein
MESCDTVFLILVPVSGDALMYDLLLEDKREGLAEVHVEDVQRLILHHIWVEHGAVRSSDTKKLLYQKAQIQKIQKAKAEKKYSIRINYRSRA